MRRILPFAVTFLLLPLHSAAPLAGQITDRNELVAALDSTARVHAADSTVAGVAVAVVQGSDTLLLDGFGYADLEFEVPTPADAVYEIGSVTKQFTAAAILQLAEADSLDLDADPDEYLPDYRTRGRRISIRRLLNHTSGIREITDLPIYSTIRARDLPRDTLLGLSDGAPLEFEPGTKLSYSNFGYILLGHVIEGASGQPYEKYVKEHLFAPAGMDDSYYCDERATVHHRAHGYDWSGPERGLVRKGYFNYGWPFSAGSLCSTVGDLLAWNRAFHGGKILSDSSYTVMTTPDTLLDGTRLRYAMGLAVHDTNGHRVIDHSGSIDGFFAQSSYYPDEDLIVVVLQNSRGPRGPGDLANELTRLVLGPGEKMPEVTPYEGDLSKFTGRYTGRAGGRTETNRIEADSAGLVVYLGGSGEELGPFRLRHLDGLTWRVDDGPGPIRLTFIRSGDRVIELRTDFISGNFLLRRIGSH